jgi:uncharacterized membrane protein YeaQ/YmgE (transglycosylase-associated protein family)
MTNFLLWIVVGLIAGFLASKVLSGRGMGVLMDVVVGILGAFLGGFLAGMAGIQTGGLFMQVVVAFVGAVILLLAVRALGGQRLRAR